ncbi:MAG: N-6 DNA methylase, partial [Gammaproteobacteria bacterium]|nr:N-6 DNA methylase [Gammaproteobacteria bacterium]
WSQASGTVAPVDYRNMGPEELGSVYESLLELVPDPDPHARTFAFVNASADGDTKGNARKTTGSYYTPDSLVQELIKSALDPVIEARIASQPDRPTEALLGITVVDPACGSGHFLLAAARRLAERLAALRAPEGAVRAQDYRHALREVITHCIHGVDRNPMALELARFALWLEGFEEGRPLGFLDHHLVCGDALIGITDVGQLAYGIPDAAFKPLSGDDKAVCKMLARENKDGLKAFARRKRDANLPLALERDTLLAERAALEAMPDDTLAQQAAKGAAWQRYADQARGSRLQQAADLFVGAFLAPKAAPQDAGHTPTSQNLYLALFTEQRPEELKEAKQAERLAQATQRARDARVLHWPLAFVQVFQKGGFDCVLGNPPWERIKLQEEEFFAAENRLVAQARNKAERAQRIEWLAQGMLARHLYPELEHAPDEAAKEQEAYARFIAARRIAEAASVFAHLKADEGGRYPLTGVGDVNTYALFAETIDQVIGRRGRAGFIVPTGIATDDSTKAYFAHVAQGSRLASLYDFENREAVFPGVHRSYKFCLLTLGSAAGAEFGFFFTQTAQLADERRRFTLTAEDFARINPNTLTCPVFRSRKDAELTKKIYERVPVLIREARGGEPEVNPWGISFMRMFDMSNDSHLFAGEPAEDRLPLYEAKMIHQYDHRWATYRPGGNGDVGADVSVDVPLADKRDPAYAVRPRYWVEAREVYLRTAALPKGLLTALRERDRPVIVLAIADLLFADWLVKRHRAADEAMQHLYPEWCAFIEEQPFARHLAPTQLGLAADNPPCLKPLGPHYLPAEAIDAVKAGPRESTAWYEAGSGAMAALLDVPRTFPVLPEVVPTLADEAAAL